MFKNYNPKIIAITIIAIITFATISYVNYLLNKPLDIDIPTHFTYNNTKIALAWTDDNTGETLIIQSDKKEYNGFNSVDVYFSITNITRRDQDMDVVVWVGNEKVKVEEMNRIEKDTNFEFQINSHPVARKPLGGYARKDINGFTTGYFVNDQIESGNTNYYKATIKYPGKSKGEFFIEAFGMRHKATEWLRLQSNRSHSVAYSAYGHLDPWYSSSYQYKRVITLNADQIATTTDAFPVLATTTLADLKTVTHGGKVTSDDGYDIIFVDDDDTTLLNFEREYYASTTGEIAFWIKTDISSTTGKQIKMYYGNSGASDVATTTGVWDDNYVMVQHLNEDWDASSTDSTQYGNDGTHANFYSATSSVDAQIDKGIDFDGSDDYVDLPDDIVPVTTISSEGVTLSAWVKIDVLGTFKAIVGQKASADNTTFSSGGIDVSESNKARMIVYNGGYKYLNGTTVLNTTNKYYITGIFNPLDDQTRIYVNGNLENTSVGNSGDFLAGTNVGYIGLRHLTYNEYFFNGIIDEVRISNTARTAGWISTEYNNQSDVDSFLTFGAEELEFCNTGASSANYTYYKAITLNNTQIATTSDVFTILATTTDADLKTTVNGGHIEDSEPLDLVFFDDDQSTLLNFEIEKYVPTTGELAVWIKTDISSTTDKTIYMYYGYSSATKSYQCPTGTWDDNFVMVNHLSHDGVATTTYPDFLDSTDNDNDGSSKNMNSDDLVDGQIDGALDFDSPDYVQVADSATLNPSDYVSISMWINAANLYPDKILLCKGTTYTDRSYWFFEDNGISFRLNENTRNVSSATIPEASINGAWHYISGVYDGSYVHIYLDGQEYGDPVAGSLIDISNQPLGINAYGNGMAASAGSDKKIDEVRISNIARHAMDILTEYNNQVDVAAFLSYGTEENSLTISSVTDSPDPAQHSSTITFSVDWNDYADAGENIKVKICKTDSLTGQNCGGGHYASSTAFTTDDPETVTYTVQADDFSAKDYYAFVCDDEDNCSGSTHGAFTVRTTQISSPHTDSGNWYNSNWKYKRAIVLEADQISTTTDAFPVLATTTLSDLKSYAYDGNVGNSNGYDIIFVDDDNQTLLNFEREYYDPATGEIVYWIKTDISSTTDKTIYMYYGNASASDLATTTGVWDDNFVMVQHLQETDIDGGGGDIKDSTQNANNGTTTSMTIDNQVAGQIDGSLDFDGTNDYVRHNLISFGNAVPHTYTAWVKWQGGAVTTYVVPFGDNRYYKTTIYTAYTDGAKTFSYRTGAAAYEITGVDTTVLYDGAGHLLTWKVDSDRLVTVYIDGVFQGDTTIAETAINYNSIARGWHYVGAYFWNGIIDEVRISNIARTAGWIKTEYDNQVDVASFMAFGAEESLGRTAVMNAPMTNYLTDGLVGHWTFNGQDMDWASTTAEALDRSGQDNHGNVIGAEIASGKVGQALEFDGSGDYVDVPDANSLDATNVTLSAWVKSGTVGRYIIAKDPPTPTIEGYTSYSSEGNNVSSITLTKPADVVAGNLLLLIVGNDSNYTTSELNNIDGWTRFVNEGDPGNDSNLGLYWRIANGEESATTVVTWTNLLEAYGWYLRISGVDTKNPINAIGSVYGVDSDSSHDITEVTTDIDNCLCFYVLTFDGGDGYPFSVAGTGWSETTEIQSGTGIVDASGCWGTKELESFGGAGTATVTSTVGDGAIAVQFAVAPAIPKSDVPYAISTVGGGQFLIMNSGTTYTATSTTDINDNEWHHIVGSYDGTTIKIYIDGTLEDTNTDFSGNLPTNDGNVRIGTDYQSTPDNYFDGLIDEVRIYNRALSADEVGELYDVGARKWGL